MKTNSRPNRDEDYKAGRKQGKCPGSNEIVIISWTSKWWIGKLHEAAPTRVTCEVKDQTEIKVTIMNLGQQGPSPLKVNKGQTTNRNGNQQRQTEVEAWLKSVWSWWALCWYSKWIQDRTSLAWTTDWRCWKRGQSWDARICWSSCIEQDECSSPTDCCSREVEVISCSTACWDSKPLREEKWSGSGLIITLMRHSASRTFTFTENALLVSGGRGNRYLSICLIDLMGLHWGHEIWLVAKHRKPADYENKPTESRKSMFHKR